MSHNVWENCLNYFELQTLKMTRSKVVMVSPKQSFLVFWIKIDYMIIEEPCLITIDISYGFYGIFVPFYKPYFILNFTLIG